MVKKTKRRLVALLEASLLAATITVALTSVNKSVENIKAEDCQHDVVEHYGETEAHAEHWACCVCHNAWSDQTLTKLIGNTVSDRSRIDVPRAYWYNKTSGKIEYGRDGVPTGTITPSGVVSSMKYHANNANVMQFEGADTLETYVQSNLQILNPEAIKDGFGLSKLTKDILIYWSDSHTFGFQEGGKFASLGYGSYIAGDGLVLKNNTDYFVVETLGMSFSARTGGINTYAGYFKDHIVNSFEHNSNYYADIEVSVNKLAWKGDDPTGTDWTWNGGTCYYIDKVSNGVTTEFVRVTNNYPANGSHPTGVKEATVYWNETTQYVRLGIDGSMIAAGDKIILKEGSILADKNSEKNCVLVKDDITLVFDGTKFVEVEKTYSYNRASGKIEVRKGQKLDKEITPKAFIPSMNYHAKNNNVVQFAAADNLETYVQTDLKILNPNSVRDSFGLSASTKTWFTYWSDSHTFGFQEGGKFAEFGFGKYVVGMNMVMTDNTDYYVVGLVGIASSSVIGDYTVVSGLFYNNLINSFEHNGNYYADLQVMVDPTFWAGGEECGTDWTMNGGTCYFIDKVSNGITTEFVRMDGSYPGNGKFADGMKQATVFAGASQYVRFGFDGTKIVTGDKLVIKAGSILTDNSRHSVLVTADITLTFTGTGFTL